MGLLSIADLKSILVCPRCKAPLESSGTWHCTNRTCVQFESAFRESGGQPVFIDFDNSIVSASTFDSAGSPAWSAERAGRVKKAAMMAVAALNGANMVARKNAARLMSMMRQEQRNRLLVVGGASIGSGAEALYDDDAIGVVAFDVVGSPHIQFVADAHAIPLKDASVDAVWIQAVLEHVLEPAQVATEIARVLTPGGFVYADTPFMQQVHLGAYDFTRFTESGQRWLFRDFELIDSGVVWGPGTQLAWSLDYAARSVARSSKAGRLIRLMALPAAWAIDRLSAPEYASDAASAVYFLGRKSTNRISQKDMTKTYNGAQKRATML